MPLYSLLLLLVAVIITTIATNFGKISYFSKAAESASTDTSYQMKVFVIKYFPLTTDKQKINIAVTGDVGDSYATIKQRTVDITNNLSNALKKASTYQGYQNSAALPSLTYSVLSTREYETAVPMLTDGSRRPNYGKIMSDHNICDLVDNQGVREVWIFAYQGPTYPGSTKPYLSISESKMSGPWGDISNSPRQNDMPLCKNTYRVYTFNYGRGTAEALESWGHQMETELKQMDTALFTLFQGPAHPQTAKVNGRCGSVHNPPNARNEYDYANPTPQKSDCVNWNPDSVGTLTDISCATWGCTFVNDANNPALNYQTWNWQNLPGKLNTKTYQGKKLRNWWDIHGNFDGVMAGSRKLFVPAPPIQYTAKIKDTFTRADSATSMGQTDTGESWETLKGTWGIKGGKAYTTTCAAPGFTVVNGGTTEGLLEIAIPTNAQDAKIFVRFINNTNFIQLTNIGSKYQLSKSVNSVTTLLGETNGLAPASGDQIKIETVGSNIIVSINGVVKINAIEPTIKGTKFGIGSWCNSTIRFDNFTFSVPPYVDKTGPQLSITNPKDQAMVLINSRLNISASATDVYGMNKVEFYVNNVLKCSDTVSAYTCSWTNNIPSGQKGTILVKAYDKAGNVSSASVIFNSVTGDQPTNPSSPSQ